MTEIKEQICELVQKSIQDKQYNNEVVFDIPFKTVKRIAKHLHEKFPGKKRVGVMLEGLDVEHVHAKLFAIDSSEEYRNRPDMSIDPNHAALAEMADYLRIEESINV